MSGISIVSDTNTLIYLLDDSLTYSNIAAENLDGKQVWISVITELELFGKKGLRKSEIKAIEQLVDSCFVVDLNANVKSYTKALMQKIHMKLPDAIIAATSLYLGIPLLTSDDDFKRVPHLDLVLLEL